MLYAITLTYTSTAEKMRDQLDAHKSWLVKHIKSENVLLAGPITDGSGGFILAHAENLLEIERIMDKDPFVINRIVKTEIIEADPAVCSPDFPRQWI